MTNQPSTDTQVSWTWADQISTYRFWGLLVFYFLSAVCVTSLSTFLSLFLTDELGLQFRDVGIVFTVIAIAGLFGFYVVWVATRWKTIPVLIIAGVLQLLGGLLITTPGLASITILRLAGAFFFGLGAGVVMLAIPSILSGGRGGDKAFVISFGIVFVVTHIGEAFAPALMGALRNGLGIFIPVCMILGLIVLLPVKPSLFNAPPPQRIYPLVPTRRDPISVAILCLIPFYWLYWLYRAHGEVASIAPSRNILSPQASWLASTFAPLLYPVIANSLIDALNTRASELGKPSYSHSWVIFLWAFTFPPVAMALVQSDLNKAMVELTSQAT